MDFTLGFPLEPVWWNWYLTGLVLIILELLMPGVWIIWIGLGALVTGIITQIFGGFAWQAQFLLFAVLSCVSLYLGKRWFMKKGPTDPVKLNQRLSQYLDRVVTLHHPIVDGRGKIQLDDTLWSVKGPDTPAGKKVRIVGAEGVYLVVRPEAEDRG